MVACSFCGKSQREVELLIQGPAVVICNECVDLSAEIVEEQRAKDALSREVEAGHLTPWEGVAMLADRLQRI